MSAVVATDRDAIERTEALLYAWGDECRSRADDLGLPRSSGIKRMIEQREGLDRLKRGARSRRRRDKALRRPVTFADGTVAVECLCGLVHLSDVLCPRCKGDPRAPDRSVRATETRSPRPPSLREISASAVAVDLVVAAAPNWMRKVLMLSYLWVERDAKAALRLRIRVSTYREQRQAAVEYVAERLAASNAAAV